MAKNKALSLRVQWLGERLRRARERAGHTLETASDHLQVRRATLSRFENGVYRPRPSYVRDLVDFYGISEKRERDILLQLNDDAWRKDWWIGDNSDLDDEFVDYTWLEDRASQIHTYEPLLIHGLLQTSDYTKALAKAGLGQHNSAAALDRPAEVRSARQQILTRQPRTHLSVTLEEAPLYRRIGTTTVHRQQLERLLESQQQPNIDIRIVPRASGWHPALDGPFTLLSMADPYPDVAYHESLIGRTFLEEEDKVDIYRGAYDQLQAKALSPKRSAALISQAMKELR